MASNINTRYTKVRTSPRPWHWYYDRLPKQLREALANSDHNWADEQIYNLWKGVHGYKKLGKIEIAEIIKREDERLAYNWMDDV